MVVITGERKFKIRLIMRALLVTLGWLLLSNSITMALSVFGPQVVSMDLAYVLPATVDAMAQARKVEDDLTEALAGIAIDSIDVGAVPAGVEYAACGSHALRVKVAARVLPTEQRVLLGQVNGAVRVAGLGQACLDRGVRVSMNGATAVWFGQAALALLVLLLIWRRRSGSSGSGLIAHWTPRMVGRAALHWGVGGGLGLIAFSVAAAALWYLSGVDLPPERPPMGTMAAITVLVGGLLIAPIFEEYVFRAWLLEQLSHVMPIWFALSLSALAFMLIHVPSNWPLVAIYMIDGILLGLLWLRTRSLLSNVIAHGLTNLVLFGSGIIGG
ncbi:MAG: CPBP family intramembrane metalloprotease [Dokdonella sp.]|uniref:CPBP family intramembrane glutamic endopeptidase n=1 Tax=Dokdonella sp. TaxID=2291710 RepID=UPI0025C16BA6|nr:CPBP family intramembrane glutamic endopeptidase [Dokdonella sp.]MBZ0222928.1 CPBP family intramembrane metalloprotease [Dokdonella sp.]